MNKGSACYQLLATGNLIKELRSLALIKAYFEFNTGCSSCFKLTVVCLHISHNARVFNLSLKEGVVPFEWKEANIIPLFKKDSRNKSENYRPVSLTSVICKLLERLIKDHMVDFLVKHKLLNSSQHGFLKARSNMLCFLEEITKWIDVGSPVDIIYLDFQKAFHKVSHQRLLLKLKAHGIRDSITD